ncbi:hypothetical protein HK101_001936 [Irineochytrium annulatum]|nr:hypothetical protein HK101_001936 [Irineochytrium annulatum]
MVKTEEFPVSEATADEMIAAALGDGDDSGISGAGADHPAIQDMLTGDTADSDARESFSPLPMDGALVNGTLKRKTEETGTKVDPPSEDRHEPPPPRVSLASPSFTPKIRRSTSRNSNSGTRQSGHLASPVAKRASRRIDVESGHPTYDPANANALTNSRDIAGLMRAVLKEELATAVNRIRMELTEGRPIRTGGFRHKALQNGEGGYPFMDDDDGELCVAELATTAGLEAVHSLIEERNVAIAMSEECKEFAEAAVYRAVELTVARDKMDEICNKVQRERDIAIEAQIRSEELVAKLQKENQFLLEALLEKRKANHV